MLELLLNAGADVSVQTTAGKSLLAIAVSSANVEAVKVLLQQKADPNQVCALHYTLPVNSLA